MKKGLRRPSFSTASTPGIMKSTPMLGAAVMRAKMKSLAPRYWPKGVMAVLLVAPCQKAPGIQARRVNLRLWRRRWPRTEPSGWGADGAWAGAAGMGVDIGYLYARRG